MPRISRDQSDPAAPAPLTPLLPLRLELAPLPAVLTSLVGRDQELDTLRALWRDRAGTPAVRLLTLTGPGGVGKTRLALELARQLAADFADGAVFVPLALVAQPDLVLGAIAQALSVQETPDWPQAERLQRFLRERRILVVLDNFEHLLAAAPVVTDLLAASPGLRVLVTSRERLRLSGEQVFPVPPLALPEATEDVSPEAVGGAEAVALFVARARATKPDFALTNANAPVVADICRHLDGLPLAIELAAARVGHMPPAMLLGRLGAVTHRSEGLHLLAGGPRDQPTRHQTMRAAIAWSYDLLSRAEQALVRQLAVFAGGLTLQAAEAVAGRAPGSEGVRRSRVTGTAPSLPAATLDLIASLLDKSLLQQTGETNGEPRYAMLETIREYGLERLTAAEAEAARRRHAKHYLALVIDLERQCKGTGTIEGLDRLAIELPNLRAAVTWAIEAGEVADALRLVAAIYPSFWFSRGDAAEGRRWLEMGLARDQDVPPRVRADALDVAAMLAAAQGDFARALALAEASEEIGREQHDPFVTARARFCFGLIAEWQRDFAAAATLYDEALGCLREAGDPYWIALALTSLAIVLHWREEHDRAAVLATEGLDRWRLAGNPWGLAMALTTAAAVAAAQGNHARSAELHRESLDLWLRLDDKRGIAGALAGLADVAAANRHLLRAARLLGAATGLVDAINVRTVVNHEQYERAVSATRLALGEQAFLAATATGRALPRAEAIAEAKAAAASVAPDRSGQPASSAATRDELSPREVEVLRLLVEGRSDREIADQLSISPRTVSHHVAAILGHLGLESRTAAATHAVRHRLV